MNDKGHETCFKVVMGTTDKYAFVPLTEGQLSDILKYGQDIPSEIRDLLQRAGENIFRW